MIDSVIECGKLNYDPKNATSYLMNEREKVNPTFIKNDRQVAMYMLDIGIDGSRPFPRIDVKKRREEETSTSTVPPLSPPQSTIHDNLLRDNGFDDRLNYQH